MMVRLSKFLVNYCQNLVNHHWLFSHKSKLIFEDERVLQMCVYQFGGEPGVN